VEDQNQLVTVFRDQPRENDVTKDEDGTPKPPICPWSLQKDDGENSKVRLQSFKMRTPNGSPVFVSLPKYDAATVPKRYWYDCHTYALGCYEKFNYTVEAGSLWDVLHDPDLATTIGENLKTPVIQGRNGKFNLEEGKEPETKCSFSCTSFDQPGYQPQTHDIMVLWEYVRIPENTGPWYIRAHHSFKLKELEFRNFPHDIEEGDRRYIAGRYLEFRYTTAMTKNGSDEPKEAELRKILGAYPSFELEKGGPAGIYRLVGHRGESSLMDKRQANSCNRNLFNSGMTCRVVRQERCSGGYKDEIMVALENLKGLDWAISLPLLGSRLCCDVMR
jgi:hypothetical protein